jgi:hypothetical protein
MKVLGVGLLALIALPLFSKAPTEKITLSPEGRSADITDAVRLEQFRFSAGPQPCLGTDGFGTDVCSAPRESWIADWTRGPITNPEASLPRYDVTYHFGDGERRVYVVYFAYSPSAKQGYIYLPGPGEPHYQANVNLLYHGKQWEGHWYLATPEWTSAAQEVISRLR